MTKRLLYIHAGISKTGTSYIQSSLAYSREHLLKYGLYYPTFSEKPEGKYGLINSGNGYFLAQMLNPQFADNLFNEEREWQRLKKAICSGYSRILISSEFIAAAKPEYLEKLKVRLTGINTEVKILIFLRSILERTYSNWQQAIKRHGSVANFESQVRRAKENHFDRLNKLVEIFGESNIYTHNYDTKKDVLLETIADFIEVPSIKECPVKTVNRSLGLQETSRMLFINQLSKEKAPDKAAEIARITSDLIVEADPVVDKYNILITDETRDIFIENNRKVLEGINKKYMAHDPIKFSLNDTLNKKMVFPELSNLEKDVFTAIHTYLTGKDQNYYLDPLQVEQLDATSIYILSSRAFLKQNKINDALWAAKQAIRKSPSEPRAYYELAKSLEKNNALEGAVDAMQKAVNIWPEKIEYQSYLGYLLSRKMDLRGANQAFRKVFRMVNASSAQKNWFFNLKTIIKELKNRMNK